MTLIKDIKTIDIKTLLNSKNISKYGKNPVIDIGSEICVINKSDIYYFGYNCDVYSDDIQKVLDKKDTQAFFVKIKDKYHFIFNGDSDAMESEFQDLSAFNADHNKAIGTSFTCICRLFDIPFDIKKLSNLINNGNLKFIDATPDHTIEFSEKEREYYNHGKEKELKPPKKGYRILGGQWHCPGSLVIAYRKTKAYQWQYAIFSMDEDSYFGSLLPKSVKTVKDAFLALEPKEVQEASKKSSIQRQGEWFLIPKKENEIPDLVDCQIVKTDAHDEYMHFGLPIENKDSNIHEVSCKDYRIQDGQIFVKDGSLYHDNHEEINFKGWYKFVRNTAIKSVSVDGVD